MAKTNWTSDWRVWGGVFLGAAILAITYLWFVGRDGIPTVQVVQVTRTAFTDYVSCNGNIEPIEPHVYRAEFETFVTGAFAKEGQPVKRGETILTLDASQIRADLAQARTQLLAAQEGLRNARVGGPPDEKAQLIGDLRQAEVDVQRLQERHAVLEKLFEAHASTQEEVNQNTAALARAQALLDTLQKKQNDFAERATEEEKSYTLRAQQAEEQVHLLESKLQSATVTAGMDGTLYSFPLRVGDFVRVGETLAEIADLRKVRLRAFVDESDLGQLKLNQNVEITWDAMPDRAWSGKTEQIPKQVLTRGTRSVGEVFSTVDNTGLELLPNVNVDVRILVQENHNALVVPRETVRTEQGAHFVYVLNGDRIHRRPVSLGLANSTSYEVVSGLNEGEFVAVPGNFDLHDGSVVHPSETK